MTTLIEPYTYVRTITLGLGTIWTLQGLVRMLRFTQRWKGRLLPLGASKKWLRNMLVVYVLRTTILDPINLALLLTLFGLWGVRAIV